MTHNHTPSEEPTIYSNYRYIKDLRLGTAESISEDVLTVQFPNGYSAGGGGGGALIDQDLDVEFDEFDFDIVGTIPVASKRNICLTRPDVSSVSGYDAGDVLIDLTLIPDSSLTSGDCSKITRVLFVNPSDSIQTPDLTFIFFNRQVSSIPNRFDPWTISETESAYILGVTRILSANWVQVGNQMIASVDANVPLLAAIGNSTYFSIITHSSFNPRYDVTVSLFIEY